MATPSINRVIAFGASAGGFKAVVQCLKDFSPGDGVTVLIVLHGYNDVPKTLAERMSKLVKMPVLYAQSGMIMDGDKIFLSPPNQHLVVKDGRMFLTNGPKENLFRPSIDVLFRSVAVEYQNKAIGVLLTGRLTDGTLGLDALKKSGSITIIQDPETAEYGDMPRYAQVSVFPDYVLPLDKMADIFEELINDPLPPVKEIPESLIKEVEVTNHISGLLKGEEVNEYGDTLSCPSCGGPLKIHESVTPQFRCRIGHSFTLQSLDEEQELQLEKTLWVAMRILDERSAFLKKMVSDYQRKGFDRLADAQEEKLHEIESHSQNLKKIIGII